MRLSKTLCAWVLAHAASVGSNPVPDADHWDGQDGHAQRHGCLCDESAAKIVSAFENLFVHISPQHASKYLASDFKIFSDSTNYVTPGSDWTPGAATVGSRDDFVKQQTLLQATPQPNFTTLAVYHTCDTIFFRWHLNFPTPVAGIDVIVIKPGTHLIQTDYSEFNSNGLLANFGCHSTGGLCG